ncbi:MAG: hypothetical protein ACRD2O_02925 [Terriglobia bacterium]
MAKISNHKLISLAACCIALSLAATSSYVLAQDAPGGAPPASPPQQRLQQQNAPPDPGWHRFSHSPQDEHSAAAIPSRLTLKPGPPNPPLALTQRTVSEK